MNNNECHINKDEFLKNTSEKKLSSKNRSDIYLGQFLKPRKERGQNLFENLVNVLFLAHCNIQQFTLSLTLPKIRSFK